MFQNIYQSVMDSSSTNTTISTPTSSNSVQASYEVEQFEQTPLEWVSLVFLLLLTGLLVTTVVLAVRLEENNFLFLQLNQTLEARWNTTQTIR